MFIAKEGEVRKHQSTNLCLSSIALMAGNSDIIEDPMQLGHNVVDLGGQVARVDCHVFLKSDNPKHGEQRLC